MVNYIFNVYDLVIMVILNKITVLHHVQKQKCHMTMYVCNAQIKLNHSKHKKNLITYIYGFYE